MTTHEARTVEKWPIEKPEPEDWEVRVVVWKCRNVPASDLGGFSDAYLRLFMIGHENNYQQTDTHLRSQRGKSSFNYRIKMPVKLPLSTTAEGAGRMVVQIWDFDMLEGDDVKTLPPHIFVSICLSLYLCKYDDGGALLCASQSPK
jgi:hypothetical protein